MTSKKEKLTVEQLLELPGDFAEKIIIKQLLKPESTDSSYFIYQNFQERWFDNNSFSQLFKILKAYWTKYQSFPSKTLLTKILAHEKYKESKDDILNIVNDILDIKESDFDKTYLQDMIVRFTKERAIYFTVLDNISIIEKHKDLNSCFSKFEEIAKYDLNTDLGIEYFENIEKHVERLNKPDLKIPTGIYGLDKVLYGGIPVDDTCLFLFMAQPGLGKSMFMANIAANWILMGKKVLIISLEMSEHMYSMRMDSLFASININKLKDASENLLKRVKALKLGVPTAQLQIKEFPTGTCSSMMIKQYLKKLKEVRGFEPDIIVIDYLNIMKPNSGGSSMNMYEKGKSVAEELRAISGEFHIPLISAIQANRCLEENSKVYVKNKGYILLKDLQINDFILSNNGFNKVTKIYPKEIQKTYQIITSSGKKIICSYNHIWPTTAGLKSLESGLSIGDTLIKRNLFDCIADNIGHFINKIKRFIK